MKVLLVYPKYPDTFWSFKHALRFISKKASFPPLGLLTIASMLPENWELKLVDMNTSTLEDRDILWADYVFISAMIVQKESAQDVIKNCRKLGVPIVAGGPLFTMEFDEFEGVDHFILNEAEHTLVSFLLDLENGNPQHVYTSTDWPDIKKTPLPQWDLIPMKKYASMSIQYSRGCPYNCEFCDIILLNGHKPRTKSTSQVLEELNALYMQGWRGSLFFVDDNFIGNKKKLKQDLLPALIQWMTARKYPFHFFTEASINLADDIELMRLMTRAGFEKVFIGIETPNEESLSECNKYLNKNRNLVESVKTIQKNGLQVQGGFIVGFDNDPPSIFEKQINFIQNSGIVTAMVGLLNAPRGTRLYKRLQNENRLIKSISGSNTDFSLNFIPKMNVDILLSGYKKILNTIYSPKNYYKRVITFLKTYKPEPIRKKINFKLSHLNAFFKSIWFLGIQGKERVQYWKLISWTIIRRPRFLHIAVTLAIYGFHFRKVVDI